MFQLSDIPSSPQSGATPTNDQTGAGERVADESSQVAMTNLDPTADLSEAMETVNQMITGLIAALPKIGIAIVAFIAFAALAWMIRRIIMRATRKHPSAHFGKVLGRLGQWTTIIVGIMVAVAIVAPTVTPAKLLAGLGVGSVAIGFAFKDVLQNFLAGILILLRQPFKIGDIVRFNDHEGTVEEIDTRLTIIKTFDGRRVMVPNGEIYTNPITVLTAYGQRRSQYDVGIGYGDDLDLARREILKAIKSVENVASEPAPDVKVAELADSSVNLRARWWCDDRKVLSTFSDVLTAIKQHLDEAAIDMPYPTQVMLFHDQTEQIDGDRRNQREGWPAGANPPKPRRSRDFAAEAPTNGAPA